MPDGPSKEEELRDIHSKVGEIKWAASEILMISSLAACASLLLYLFPPVLLVSLVFLVGAYPALVSQALILSRTTLSIPGVDVKILLATFVSVIWLIAAYGACYRSLEISNADTSLDHLYFSIVTFTTLGYGDITPVGLSRFFSSAEAISGFSIFPLLVAEFYSVIKQRNSRDLEMFTELDALGRERRER